MAIAAQIVASQVNQHYVFGIFLGVVAQVLGILSVCLCITGTLCGSCNGVYICLAALYTAMRLGAGAEDAETAEVEVEQIRTGVDAAKGSVELEVVTLVTLFEAPGEYNLENITSQAMSNTLADILTMLIIG